MVARDRPVEQREQVEVVDRQIDRARLAGLDRGAPVEDQAQALQPGLADLVDLGEPGEDVGEAGLARSRR